jgi:hypothetical protein
VGRHPARSASVGYPEFRSEQTIYRQNSAASPVVSGAGVLASGKVTIGALSGVVLCSPEGALDLSYCWVSRTEPMLGRT